MLVNDSNYFRCLLFVFAVFCSNSSIAVTEGILSQTPQEITKIRVIPSSESDFNSHAYYTKLLKLALDKTREQYGAAEIVKTEEMMVQDRFFIELNHGVIDVYWTVTSAKRELEAIPIRVPLLYGMMGYRISLILKERKHEFLNQDVTHFLNDMIAGQGHDWPDYSILKSNEMLVLGTSHYDSLIELLKRRRIDHFPRAINETLVEIETLQDDKLAVEPTILIHYPSYIFFFVAKSKPVLAERLEHGLKLAVADGSFQCVFESYINVAHLNNKLGITERVLLALENPLLSKETRKLTLPQLWQIKTASDC